MYKLAVALSFCLILPRLAAAEPIVAFADGFVTWEAVGEIEVSSRPLSPLFPEITVGTPFAMRVSFNGNAIAPTPLGNSPECVSVNLSGWLMLGSTTYTGSGFGFTNAVLPGSNCEQSELTQFTFTGSLISDTGTPFSSVYGPAIIVASYRDLLVQDVFAGTPVADGPGWLFINRLVHGGSASGSFEWRVVDPAAASPVPEPGTLTLFALGAAAIARRVRGQRLRQ